MSEIIHPETVKKVSFVSKSHKSKIADIIDPKQLEKKYGGSHDDLTTFFPPLNTVNYPPPFMGEEIKLSDSSDPSKKLSGIVQPLSSSIFPIDQHDKVKSSLEEIPPLKIIKENHSPIKQEENLLKKLANGSEHKNSQNSPMNSSPRNNKKSREVKFLEDESQSVRKDSKYYEGFRERNESLPSIQKLHLPLEGFVSPRDMNLTPRLVDQCSQGNSNTTNVPPPTTYEPPSESKGGCCGANSQCLIY